MASFEDSTGQSHSENFFKYFQKEIAGIQEQVDRLADPTLIQSERKNGTDQCIAKITRLASEVADASGELPTYDQRSYNETIKGLQDQLVHIQATLAPKSKFSFRSKKNTPGLARMDLSSLTSAHERNPAIPGYLTPGGSVGSPSSSRSATPAHLRTPDEDRPLHGPVPSAPPPPTRTADEPFLPGDPDYSGKHQNTRKDPQDRETSPSQEQNILSISSHKNEYVTAPAPSHSSSASINLPCNISSIDSCILNLSPETGEQSSPPRPLASITLTNIQSSLLLLNRPISGPAHITSVRDSTILLSCRQFRMHDCENVNVYLFCSSRPIIESCSGINFISMPDHLFELIHPQTSTATSEGERARSRKETNMYDHIDDFKWLKAEPSPNWSLMKPEEGITDSVWDEALSLKPGADVSKVLQGTGVAAS